jgi:hypothetical protein
VEPINIGTLVVKGLRVDESNLCRHQDSCVFVLWLLRYAIQPQEEETEDGQKTKKFFWKYYILVHRLRLTRSVL